MLYILSFCFLLNNNRPCLCCLVLLNPPTNDHKRQHMPVGHVITYQFVITLISIVCASSRSLRANFNDFIIDLTSSPVHWYSIWRFIIDFQSLQKSEAFAPIFSGVLFLCPTVKIWGNRHTSWGILLSNVTSKQ